MTDPDAEAMAIAMCSLMLAEIEDGASRRRVLDYLIGRFRTDSMMEQLVERLKDHGHCIDRDEHERLLRESLVRTR